ncbi:AraC family transcriptional regulator [Pedobacter sp. GR22-10]|uniref:AraC family transcriptional regulator n=1 Tax=Pedobacter sp. GR22-10 TaxID=2994472 RepID=UPI002245C384|nr:helix-turn-helix transcriptional regulator [Pedobacter sp. GR22-10]MCX2430399.1 helix-turn-helix transcriptional regulator [Pedobacter sp. GR22-10]
MPATIKKYEFKEGLPHEFEILDLETVFHFASDTLTVPHRTGFYHIIWFERGEADHLIDFNPVHVSANTILFLNKDIVHCFDPEGNFVGKMILFTDGFYCRNEQDARFLKSSVLFNAIHGTTQIHIEGKLVEVLNELIVLMNEEAEKSKDSRQSEIIQNFLHNFLLLAEREQSHQPTSERAKGPDYELVLLFKDLLEHGFLQRRLISDYAREMFVTEKRLNQATSKILGKTAKAVTNDRMVLEAKRLLSHTAKSIKEISYSLGFEEPTNFIKYFRKHNGLTPVEFREKYAIK